MRVAGQTYEEAYGNFRWEIPERFNIAEAICDRVVILHRGAVLASGTVGTLRERAGLPGSGLEDVFLALTGTDDLTDVVKGLVR